MVTGIQQLDKQDKVSLKALTNKTEILKDIQEGLKDVMPFKTKMLYKKSKVRFTHNTVYVNAHFSFKDYSGVIKYGSTDVTYNTSNLPNIDITKANKTNGPW